VEYLKGRLADEKVVDGRDKGAGNDDGNAGEVHSVPELFELVRVGLHQVVGGAGEQAELAGGEEDDEHDIVCRPHVLVPRLGQDSHVDVGHGPYQEGAEQVRVDVASLVVHVRQAEQHRPATGRLWAVATTDELVVSRPFLDLLVAQQFVSGEGWCLRRFRGRPASSLQGRIQPLPVYVHAGRLEAASDDGGHVKGHLASSLAMSSREPATLIISPGLGSATDIWASTKFGQELNVTLGGCQRGRVCKCPLAAASVAGYANVPWRLPAWPGVRRLWTGMVDGVGSGVYSKVFNQYESSLAVQVMSRGSSC
jgi:hypothetical protein